jgi:AcrR family transcriptional regulator
MSSEKRRYEKRERAAKQEQTRRRIAAATAELHSSIGPARTTIAEIANRAGVQRPTVYNNFATDKELFAACQAHFLSESPPPALDPARGLEANLRDLYSWWRANAGMSGNVARDRGAVPALDELMRETSDARFDALADALGRTGEERALIRIALRFETWRTLADRGLSDAAAARAIATRI